MKSGEELSTVYNDKTNYYKKITKNISQEIRENIETKIIIEALNHEKKILNEKIITSKRD